eukprot:344913-Pelagomonas_calceolata.AAC.3
MGNKLEKNDRMLRCRKLLVSKKSFEKCSCQTHAAIPRVNMPPPPPPFTHPAKNPLTPVQQACKPCKPNKYIPKQRVEQGGTHKLMQGDANARSRTHQGKLQKHRMQHTKQMRKHRMQHTTQIQEHRMQHTTQMQKHRMHTERNFRSIRHNIQSKCINTRRNCRSAR